MRHFVAYHNTQRMGRSLHDGDALELGTDKPVNHLVGNVVWFIVGDGGSPKQYALGSVFVVSEIGETTEGGFSRFARGAGHIFEPMPRLNDLAWFSGLFKTTAHFSLGLQEVKDQQIVSALLGLAAETGYEPV